ncbi:hypothetical protein KDL44_13380 [bacterium]|nr:hypothetical protein [bacterium]
MHTLRQLSLAVLTAFILLLHCSPAGAEKRASSGLDGGIASDGMPLGITSDKAMSYLWDGTPRSPVANAVLSDIFADRYCTELEEVNTLLSLDEENRRRVFLTPEPVRGGGERLLACTMRRESEFLTGIMSWPDLKPVAEISLDRMLLDLYGTRIEDPTDCELQLRSVARNPDGDLVLLVLLQAGNTWTTEFGVWTEKDWLPLQLPQFFDPAGRLTAFSETAEWTALDRIHFGPDGEMLLCTADGVMAFYEADPRTGAYILRQEYTEWDLRQQHGVAVRSLIIPVLLAMVSVLICTAMIAWLVMDRRRRRAA